MMTYHFYFIFPYENYFSLTTQNPKGKTIIELGNNHLWICETLLVNISISCFYYSYIKYQYFSLFDNFVMMYTHNNECLSLINGVVFI